jgi:hypothetical protein
MADVDREEADAGEPSRLRKHQSIMLVSVMLLLVVGHLSSGAARVWAWLHPTESAKPRISDIQTTDQTPFQSATATVRVHNDGKSSIGGCVIHWMAQAPLGQRGLQTLGTSPQFGLGPGEYRARTFFGPEASPTSLPLMSYDTWAYVQCASLRSPHSAHRQVSMSRPIP